MNMNAVNQKEYLKKYLKIGKSHGTKKKRKKTENTLGKRLKIIDDDLDVSLSEEIKEDLAGANEDAPQIVSIIDERPLALNNEFWKPMAEADPVVHPSDRNFKIISRKEFPRTVITPTRIKSEYSPKRTGISPQGTENTADYSPKLRRNAFSGDHSPKRRTNSDSEHQSPKRGRDSDSECQSPRRQKNYDSRDKSPPRRTSKIPDYSPNRRKDYESDDQSPRRRKNSEPDQRRNGDSEDQSPRRQRHGDRDDQSPKRRKIDDADYSPKRRRDIVAKDQSPERKRGYDKRDMSPRQRHGDQDDQSPKRRKIDDADHSPKRRRDIVAKDQSPERKRGYDKRDMSPRRRNNEDYSRKEYSRKESTRQKQKTSRWGDNSPERSSASVGKAEKTLSGKKSGLQNAKDLINELNSLKERENEMFQKMTAEVSGVNAATVSRKKKTTTPEEDAEQQRKQRELEAKYSRWGTGLKQVEDRDEKLADQLHEMSKPLARYADDEDLERYQKEQLLEGDPMLMYMRKKKRKQAVEAGIPDKPVYMGDFMPNRFGISPGYRWDGVDRSNGYEQKLFQAKNSEKASLEEALMWNTEDM